MAYKVKFRRNNPKGKVIGELGPFPAQKVALKQAQVMADSGHLPENVIVTVERVGGKRKNPRSQTYKGHKIKGKTGKYTVEPYGYEFPTLKATKAWLDEHVRDAYPKPKKATKKRKNTGRKKNPSQPTVEIQREGYHRKGYWRTSSKGKRTWVPPTYVAATHFEMVDKGRPGVRSFGAKSAGEGYRGNPHSIELPNSNLYLVGIGKDVNGNSVIKLKYPNSRAFSIQLVGTGLSGLFRGKRSITGKERPSWVEKVEKEVIYHIRNYGSLGQKQGLRAYGAGGDYSTSPEKLGWPTRSNKRPTKKEMQARRYDKPLITREGKLGGPGYTKKPAATRQRILSKCVKKYGYRSCLGSLLVLLKNSEMGRGPRQVITRDKNWLEKKYGGPGSFGPER